MLLQQGTWDEAERELTAAIDVLGRGWRASLVDGIARLGELRRRQGCLGEARALFAQSELNSISRLGAVELALGEQDGATAEAAEARAAFAELPAEVDAVAAADLLAQPNANGPLTRRELEVIALVAAGRSNREIAERLVVSEHTVHRHVANILGKLGEPTRAAAAARATRDGLV